MKRGLFGLIVMIVGLFMVQGVFAQEANDLIGVDPVEPTFSLEGTGSPTSPLVVYNGTTLTITSTPKVFLQSAGGVPQLVTGGAFFLSANIDASGILDGGTFSLTGTVAGYSGTLLSGEVDSYGIVALGNNTNADFKLYANAGSMLGLFTAGNAGLTVTFINSTFTGGFAAPWMASSNSGELGYFPDIPPAACSGVYPMHWYQLHPNQWPADQLVLGNKTYNKKQLKSILYGPFCDKTFLVAKEQIATKFNLILNAGAGKAECRECIEATVVAVDEWLIANPIGSRKHDWEEVKVQWKNEKKYNHGELCTPSYRE